MHLSEAILDWLKDPIFKNHFEMIMWGNMPTYTIECECGVLGYMQAKVYDTYVEFLEPRSCKIEAADPEFFQKMEIELFKTFRHFDW